MKKFKILICLLMLMCFVSSTSFAFWVWTPKDQKVTDPSKVVKDTPKKQYEFAMRLFDSGQYKEAGDEFVRLVENWKDSKFTPDAQYYAGVSYQKAKKPYIAFKNYEKVIKFYPYSKHVKDIVKAEYKIGEHFYNTSEAKLMGVELMGDAERAIEIFSAIITNMPYSEYADKAQFMIGKSYKKLQQYNEAALAFKKLVQEYPKSKLVDKAKFEVAECMSLYSKGSDYDQASTDEAIKEFKKYAEEFKDEKVQEQAAKTLNVLSEKKAKSIYDIAAFYHRMKKYRAAYIYYSQVINEYRDTTYYKLAEEKLKGIKPILDKQEGKVTEATKKMKQSEKKGFFNEVLGSWFGGDKKKEASSQTSEAKKKTKVKETKEAQKEPVVNKAINDWFGKDKKKKASSKQPEASSQTAPPTKASNASHESKTNVEKPEASDKETEASTQQSDEKVKKKKKKKSVSFFGYTTSNVIYEGAQNIFIDAFKNKIDFTREVTDKAMYVGYRSGMELEITRLIIDRFLFDGSLRIATKKEADLYMEGALLDFKKEAIRYDTGDNVIEYRLKVIIDFTLTVQETEEVLLDFKHFTGETTYRTTGNYAITENQAIRQAIEDLAVRVVNLVVEDW